MRTISIFLRKKPHLLEVDSLLSQVAKVEILKDNLETLFAVTITQTSENFKFSISLPEKIDYYGQPQLENTRELAHCQWLTTIQFVDNKDAYDQALQIANLLVDKYKGGVYDPQSKALVYPSHAPRIQRTFDSLPPWQELRNAFNCDGALELITISTEHNNSWHDLIKEAQTLGFDIAIKPGEGEEIIVTTQGQMLLDTYLAKIDHADHAILLKLTRSEINLFCYIHDPKCAEVSVDPREVQVYADAVVIIDLMLAWAKRLGTTACLHAMGDKNNPIITASSTGELKFFRANCPRDPLFD